MESVQFFHGGLALVIVGSPPLSGRPLGECAHSERKFHWPAVSAAGPLFLLVVLALSLAGCSIDIDYSYNRGAETNTAPRQQTAPRTQTAK
jgi:hypothetical protein